MGRIVNISSLAGFLPAPYLGLYSATKHAIEGLSETLDHEVRNFGIRVVVVQPPYIRTNLNESAIQTESRFIEYADQRERVINHINMQVAQSPDPDIVAPMIERAIEAKRFQRLARRISGCALKPNSPLDARSPHRQSRTPGLQARSLILGDTVKEAFLSRFGIIKYLHLS